MIENIVGHTQCTDIIDHHDCGHYIKQPDTPSRILLMNISKVTHKEVDAPDDYLETILKQLTNSFTIVVTCGSMTNIMNIVNKRIDYYSGNDHCEDSGFGILLGILP
jgi:hypothetical protein